MYKNFSLDSSVQFLYFINDIVNPPPKDQTENIALFFYTGFQICF